MSFSRMWLASWAAAAFALSAAAAPAPKAAPPSQGPISDFLRLRGKLPLTAAPQAMRVRVDGDKIEVEIRVATYVTEVRETTRQRDGREEKIQYTVTVPRYTLQKATLPAKEFKFFEVTRDGKLEAVPARKAVARLKKPTAVLTGERSDVAPRHLELVRPGTLYLVLPLPREIPATPIPPPDRP